MPKMRTFTFNDGKESKTVEALGLKRAIKSFQSNTKANRVTVEWEAKKGGTYEKKQIIPLGRRKKLGK